MKPRDPLNMISINQVHHQEKRKNPKEDEIVDFDNQQKIKKFLFPN